MKIETLVSSSEGERVWVGFLGVDDVLFLALHSDYTDDHFIFINFIVYICFMHSSVYIIVHILEKTN